MAEQSAQQEPSMEEILASIRRIISEDGEEEASGEQAAAPGPVAVEDAPTPEPEPDTEPEEQAAQDVSAAAEPEPEPEPQSELEPLNESAPEPVEAAAVPDQEAVPDADLAAEPNPDLATPQDVADVFDTISNAPSLDDGDDVLELTQVAPEAGQAEPIVSHMTETATSEHLRALSGLMVRSYPGSENTLEGLVREMLKPMLREWLDTNLPTVVEQLVNREIARIAGRDK